MTHTTKHEDTNFVTKFVKKKVVLYEFLFTGRTILTFCVKCVLSIFSIMLVMSNETSKRKVYLLKFVLSSFITARNEYFYRRL